MMYVMTCPYYVSEKKKTVSCEGRIRWFLDAEKKRDYMQRFCCDKWEDCDYAKNLSAIYAETEGLSENEQRIERLEYYLMTNRRTVKKLIQRIGMMEKIAKHNGEMYQQDHDRLTLAKISSNRAIMNLENCIGYLLYKLGESEIDTEDFKKFMADHVVTYKVSDDQTKAVYEVKEK